MRLFNIIQCTNLGGMEQSNLLRLAGLRDLGWEPSLLSLNPLGDLKPELERYRIPARGIPYRGPGGVGSLGRLAAEVRAERFDALLMTGHNLAANLALWPLLRRRNMVLAIHFHHTGVKPDAVWRAVYRVALRTASAITFPCNFIRREAEAIHPPVARITHTVPNPFLTQPLIEPSAKVAARDQLGLPTGAFLIGNAGWLIQRKRFDLFLDVARAVSARNRDASFVIAGDGPEKQALLAFASEAGITSRVHWLGWQPDLTPFYRAIDLLLFNSDWDALGRTPLEALSFGIPVVASVANGGLSEMLRPGEHGIVLDRHDVEALASHVDWAARNPAEAARRALAGRDHLASAGSVAGHARKMAKLLERGR